MLSKLTAVYNKLFLGKVSVRGEKLSKAMIAGILGVVLLYVGVAGMVSIETPWLARGDTLGHVDYVWRIYKGEVPKWSEGLTYPEFVGKKGGHQAQSANPPLFYMLHAPFVGPLLEEGDWQQAIGVGRVINIVTGVLCILALAWAGWIFGGKRGEVFAVAVPAIAVMMHRFTRLNVDYALDAQVALIATLSMIFCYKILRDGLKPNYIVIIAVLSVLGMLTKATYIVFLLVSLAAILLTSFLYRRRGIFKKLARPLIISAVILLLVISISGWYYYMNYKTNGSWYSVSPPGYTGGRVYKSFADVITSKKLWDLLYANYASGVVPSIAISCFAIAGYINISKKRIKDFIKNKALFWSSILMGIAFLGIFIIQIKFAVGYGAINFRYMLPAILPISLLLCYGLLEFRAARGQLITMAALIMGFLSLSVLVGGHIKSLLFIGSANNISQVFPIVLLSAISLGALIICLSMFLLTKNKNTL